MTSCCFEDNLRLLSSSQPIVPRPQSEIATNQPEKYSSLNFLLCVQFVTILRKLDAGVLLNRVSEA